ncbi:hypothetical protein MBLNU457_2287t1 [Dothideomycetes sp. NU457]
MASTRNQQPTYDFLTGASPPKQPFGESTFKQSTVRADINNEQLRAQINTLQYELDTYKQEREVERLQYQTDVREAEKRAEADFKRAQTAEADRNAANKRYEALTRERADEQSRATNQQTELERKIRSLKDESQGLREDFEDAQAALSTQEREHKRAYSELEQRYFALQASVEDIQTDLGAKVTALQHAQQKTAEKEKEVGELENEILRLKAQAGDSDTLSVIKRELSEQVAHIKRLEGINREQTGELKQLRRIQKSVEVVEEEKRALETKVRIMDDLRKELAEAQLQKQILEDERMSWSSYLENQAGDEGLAYKTPEDMAKAFIAERMERISLVEKIGALQPELHVKEQSIQSLQQEKAKLAAELKKIKAEGGGTAAAGGPDSKARARLERQKNLAIKEVEYLKAQLRSLEEETIEFSTEKANETTTNRIQELETMVDDYRNEVQTLQTDLSKAETNPTITAQPAAPLKRAHEDDDTDERLGELRRKLHTMTSDLSTLQTRNATLESTLAANISQLESLRSSSRTRILELRNNPTSSHESIKASTLHTLQTENAALLSQLQTSQPSTKVVPISSLENARQQITSLETQLTQRDKKTSRLKQIWGSKIAEFAEAVSSTLGWKVQFLPNGRFKVTSILYPTHINAEGEEEENSILFDGEAGTMKVSGGRESLFAGEIRGLIEFWVDGRKEVPCFLAACTLEFYERSTRAAGA